MRKRENEVKNRKLHYSIFSACLAQTGSMPACLLGPICGRQVRCYLKTTR